MFSYFFSGLKQMEDLVRKDTTCLCLLSPAVLGGNVSASDMLLFVRVSRSSSDMGAKKRIFCVSIYL